MKSREGLDSKAYSMVIIWEILLDRAIGFLIYLTGPLKKSLRDSALELKTKTCFHWFPSNFWKMKQKESKLGLFTKNFVQPLRFS